MALSIKETRTITLEERIEASTIRLVIKSTDPDAAVILLGSNQLRVTFADLVALTNMFSEAVNILDPPTESKPATNAQDAQTNKEQSDGEVR